MKCEGTVRNKDGFDTLFVALTHLHDDHAKNYASYVIQCKGCFAKFKDGGTSMTRFDPCKVHAGGQSQYCCMGNPSSPTKTTKDLVTWLDKDSERRGYEVKEKYFILPQDILDLHQYVSLVHYNMWDLQNCVMLLGSIYTAGRFDGYHADLDMSNFHKYSGLFDVSEHKINSLAQRVKEKTDKLWHQYLLYFNDACPKICYLCHLLVFVHCAYLGQVGRLFTEEDKLINLTI
jgi:hypothetical protein